MPQLDPERQRDFAVDVVRRLRARGFTAYWAGGCVRDLLLGREAKDYDVATNATPSQIREVFGRRRTRAVGAAFGVMAVVGPRGAGTVEVVTFRRDAEYSDGRHPDSVTFSTPEEDAARRDFTINGLFFDPLDEQVIDFVGGRDDLDLGVIRAIGDPRQRFHEDKLRMLRAPRFAAALEFAIDPTTAEAIREMAAEINDVSPERIAQEMRLMLTHSRRVRAVELLDELGLLVPLLPEVAALHGVSHCDGGDLWRHTLLVLDDLKSPSFPLALATILHDVGKTCSQQDVAADAKSDARHAAEAARIAKNVCRRWKLSNKETDRVTWLVRHQADLNDARNLPWSKLQPLLTTPGIEELLDLHDAEAMTSGGDTSQTDHCRGLLELPAEELNPPPLVDGHDLLRHGVPQGPQIKRLLTSIREAQLDKKIQSTSDALALADQLLAEEAT